MSTGGAPFDVCVVGSANLDIVVTTPRLPGPGETVLGSSYAEHAGGKGLNQAVAAARAGARTALVAAVGADPAAQLLRDALTTAGADASFVTTVDRPTGRAVITVDDAGENSIVVAPGANAAVTAATLPPSAIVLVQLEVPRAAVVAALRTARDRGTVTVLNPAPAAPLDVELLRLVDVLVPNEHELAALAPADELIAGGVGAVVTTLGGTGVRVVSRDREWHQAAFAVRPVDTTAAGDAFCGALAARLAIGQPLDAAVRYAAAGGALATTVRGAVPSIPTAAAIEALLASQ